MKTDYPNGLPLPVPTTPDPNDYVHSYYSAEQVLEHARRCVAAEREAVLAACALEGVTIADIIRITQERSR